MKLLSLTLWLLCLFFTSAVHAGEFTAQVIAVLDGDTVLIKRANSLAKIRLAGIDAPEVSHAGMGGQPPNSQKSQTFGETSKQSLADMVLGQTIKVVTVAVDQYGRIVARVSINGLDVNAEQIRRGMAWEYSRFNHNKAWLALQDEAKAVPRGLWAFSTPMPPWEWRKLHPTIIIPPTANNATASTQSKAAIRPDATCGKKKYCAEMSSCDEAWHYQTQCGVKTLDGDGDGKPCETLCTQESSPKH